MIEAFLVSLSTVALAEIGDRTQLLSLVLVTRFGRPWPVLAGVLCASLASHAAASVLGVWIGTRLPPSILNAAVGAGMIVMGVWMLKPDRLSDEAAPAHQRGVFLTTAIAIFIAEIGDKTQLATLALAAAYHNLLAIIAGSTCGMMVANAPVVLIGKLFASRLPLRAIHYVASALMIVLGALFLLGLLRH